MKTIKELTEKTIIDPVLVRAVIRQAGGFSAFKEMAQDICEHGADSGFDGFIYYSDTIEFTERYLPTIMSVLKVYASEFGQSVYELIGSFKCIGMAADEVVDGMHSGFTADQRIIYNGLAWFALEEVARAYCDALGAL